MLIGAVLLIVITAVFKINISFDVLALTITRIQRRKPF